MINLYKMLLILCTCTGSVFNQDEQLTEQLKDSVRFAIALPFVNCQTLDCPLMHLDTASFATERLSLSLSNYLFVFVSWSQEWTRLELSRQHPFCYFQNMLQKWLVWHFNCSATHFQSPCSVVDGWGRVLCFLKVGQDAINKTNDETNTNWHITKHYIYHSRQKYFD